MDLLAYGRCDRANWWNFPHSMLPLLCWKVRVGDGEGGEAAAAMEGTVEEEGE